MPKHRQALSKPLCCLHLIIQYKKPSIPLWVIKKTNKNIACLLINALKKSNVWLQSTKELERYLLLGGSITRPHFRHWLTGNERYGYHLPYDTPLQWSSVFSKVGHISEKLKSTNLASGKNLIFDHKFSKCSHSKTQ